MLVVLIECTNTKSTFDVNLLLVLFTEKMCLAAPKYYISFYVLLEKDLKFPITCEDISCVASRQFYYILNELQKFPLKIYKEWQTDLYYFSRGGGIVYKLQIVECVCV